MQPLHEVAGVLNTHWPSVQQSGRFNTWQLRTLDAIKRCRTAALGAHVWTGARSVVTCAYPTTPVATGTALDVRAASENNGSVLSSNLG